VVVVAIPFGTLLEVGEGWEFDSEGARLLPVRPALPQPPQIEAKARTNPQVAVNRQVTFRRITFKGQTNPSLPSGI